MSYRYVPGRSTDLVGKSAAEIRALLGAPDHDWPGIEWYSRADMGMVRRAKSGGGFEKALPSFGLRASNIPVGQPCRTWEFQRVVRAGTVIPTEAERAAAVAAARAAGGPLPPPWTDPSSRWHVYVGVAADGAAVADADVVLEVREAPMMARF